MQDIQTQAASICNVEDFKRWAGTRVRAVKHCASHILHKLHLTSRAQLIVAMAQYPPDYV